MNSDAPLLELRGVRKAFVCDGRDEPVIALDGLDLTVAAGEFVAVVGPSGSGKSTLLDLVAGFDRPTAGTVLLRGKPIAGPSPDRVVVFQDHAVFPWLTALGNVAYGLRRQGLGRKQTREQAMDALSRMGLAAFARAYPATLSGGMRQRVALARALVLRPRILLLDEPFAALDAVTRRRLQDELVALWQAYGWAVIFVTHALSEAVTLAGRVVVLDRPPAGLCADRSIEVPRPRDRRDPRLAAHVEALRRRLGSLFPPTPGDA